MFIGRMFGGWPRSHSGEKKFNCCAPLRVNFYNYSDMDEGAIDQGGPQKEMFTLCLKGMLEGRCFVGEESKMVLSRKPVSKDHG